MSQRMQDVSFSSLKDKWRTNPFVWGEADCILSVCDYVLDETGVDPAAPWRGSYSCKDGALDIIYEYGSVLALFDYGMTKAGFERCEPQIGLPCVVDVCNEQIASVLGPRRAMFRTEKHGLLEMPAKVLGAWDIWAIR